MSLKNQADRLIRPALGKATLIKSVYDTQDIINEILSADKIAVRDVRKFAKSINFTSLDDLCYQLWKLLRDTIYYKEDGSGEQQVKFPAALWASKTGDCKSYSLFIGSVLKALNIPYSYRFVSFSSIPVYTHVYIIVHGASRDIIVDAVISTYNDEKMYTFKKDYYMKGLSRIEGIGNIGLSLPDDISNLTDAQLEARIMRERLAISHDIVAGVRGIGSSKATGMRRSIRTMDAFIGAIDNHDFAGAESIINSVPPGMGKITLKNILKKASKAVTKVVDTGKKVVTKAARAVAKVVTAPARLAAKGILEVTLPKIAPLFLYLFINDAKIIDKLPDNIRTKRKKAEKIADFIVKGIGMKRNHFMGIVRNGIMKHYKKSPEQVISKLLKDKGINGIGIVPLVATLLPIAKELLGKIMSLFGGKNAPSIDASDFPDDGDAAAMSDAEINDISKGVLSQKDAQIPGEVPDSGGRKLFGIC